MESVPARASTVEVAKVSEFQPNPYDPACPTRVVLDLVANRWTVLAIGALHKQPMTFTQLRVRLGDVTPKVLTGVLRRLERAGIVGRAKAPGPRRLADYGLTPLGRSLVKPLAGVRAWAEVNVGEILASQGAFDASNTPPARSGEPQTHAAEAAGWARLSSGQRVLVALQERGDTLAGLAARTSIPRRHLPSVVRGLNDAAPRPLVGESVGFRRAKLYALTPAGRDAALEIRNRS